jgi:hypothetical protein
MNIVYEIDTHTMRFISFNPTHVYQLDELNFYIPKENKNLNPFLLIKDSKGKQDIIKLSLVGNDNVYNIFAVALTNSISISPNGLCKLYLLTIEDDNFNISQCQELYLAFDNYTIAHQVSLINNLSRQVMNAYQKIEQLTKMNIDIYESIEEVMNK